MILNKTIGKSGRLGNQLFQHAFVFSMAKKYGCTYSLPRWEYSRYFDYYFPEDPGIESEVTITEPLFHYTPEYYDNQLFKYHNINLSGYFQSYKYFSSREDILAVFKFNQIFLSGVLQKILYLKDNLPIVAIHVRKGDYVGNDNYINLSIEYYKDCINKFSKSHFVILTDDYALAKEMFKGIDVDFSLEKMTDIEHLCFMACVADHFILSNSTFGWWGAYLSQCPFKIVCHPEHIFAGRLKRHNEKDFWPKEWIMVKDDAKYDLRDVTFVIPVSNDSPDRVENIELILSYIHANFNTNIIVGEQGTHDFCYLDCSEYVYFSIDIFHRTRMINDMVRCSSTDIIINYDADVLMHPDQIKEAVELIRNKHADIVYPYDGTFVHLNRDRCLQIKKDVYLVDNFKGTSEGFFNGKTSYGGTVVFNKEKFIEVGMENQNFISHAPEDAERYFRFNMLLGEERVKRVLGCLYHIDHWCGTNSKHNNEYRLINKSELNRVKGMDQNQLRKYVKTWPWA